MSRFLDDEVLEVIDSADAPEDFLTDDAKKQEKRTAAVAGTAVCLLLLVMLFAVVVYGIKNPEHISRNIKSENTYRWVIESKIPEGVTPVEKGLQYRSRRKMYKKGLPYSVKAGWILYNRNTVWSDEATSRSDSAIVDADPDKIKYYTTTETETVERITYAYKRFIYEENGEPMISYIEKDEGEWEYNLSPQEYMKTREYDGRQVYNDPNTGDWFRADVTPQGKKFTQYKMVEEIEAPYTLYHFQVASYTYDFWRWSDWSTWSLVPVVEDENTQVETCVVYKIMD